MMADFAIGFCFQALLPVVLSSREDVFGSAFHAGRAAGVRSLGVHATLFVLLTFIALAGLLGNLDDRIQRERLFP